MNKFPVFLNFSEAKEYYSSLYGYLDKVTFMADSYKIYNEMKSHKSLNDINEYIDKYNFRDKLNDIKDEKPFNPKDRKYIPKFSNKIYYKTKYRKFHDKVALLCASFNRYLEGLDFYKFIVYDNFDLVFTKYHMNLKLEKINSESEKKYWLRELHSRLYYIYKEFSDEDLDKIFKEFKLNTYFPIHKQLKENKPPRNHYGKYDSFKRFLINSFIPFLTDMEIKLEMKIRISFVKDCTSFNGKSKDDIFPLFSFKFQYMYEFAEGAFSTLERNIEYFSYAFSQFHSKHPDWLNDKYMLRELNQIKTHLDYLKTIYELKKNTLSTSDTKNDVVLSKENKVKSNCDSLTDLKPSLIKNSEKPIWIRSKTKLLKLLELLQIKNFIDDKTDEINWQEQYLALFKNMPGLYLSGYKLDKQVIWKGKLSDFVYLIKSLNPVTKKIRSHFHKFHYWKKLSNVFIQNSGEPFNIHSLSNYKYKIKEVHNKELIDEIILEVQKTK